MYLRARIPGTSRIGKQVGLGNESDWETSRIGEMGRGKFGSWKDLFRIPATGTYFTTKGKSTTKSFHESGPYRTDFWKSELQKRKSQKKVISARRVPPWGRGSSGGPRKIGHFEPQNPPKKKKSFIEMMAAREGESPPNLDPDAHPKG